MKQLKKEYPVVLNQDIIWGDMDAFGHINNTVYFRYFEDARIAYFDFGSGWVISMLINAHAHRP